MAKNKLTVLNLSEINKDLERLHSELGELYISRHDNDSGSNGLSKALDLLALYDSKYSELYANLLLVKSCKYSYVSERILTAILARIANYKFYIETCVNSGLSGHMVLSLLRYARSNDRLSKLNHPLVIELTANDINIRLSERG